jgi:hypothetical protein
MHTPHAVAASLHIHLCPPPPPPPPPHTHTRPLQELAEFRQESQELKNQDFTIRRLEERARELEAQLEEKASGSLPRLPCSSRPAPHPHACSAVRAAAKFRGAKHCAVHSAQSACVCAMRMLWSAGPPAGRAAEERRGGAAGSAGGVSALLSLLPPACRRRLSLPGPLRRLQSRALSFCHCAPVAPSHSILPVVRCMSLSPMNGSSAATVTPPATHPLPHATPHPPPTKNNRSSEMQEREARLSEELAQAQAGLELLRRLHNASQNQLFSLQSRSEEAAAGLHSELALAVEEMERSQQRLATLEREKTGLLDRLAAQQQGQQGGGGDAGAGAAGAPGGASRATEESLRQELSAQVGAALGADWLFAGDREDYWPAGPAFLSLACWACDWGCRPASSFFTCAAQRELASRLQSEVSALRRQLEAGECPGRVGSGLQPPITCCFDKMAGVGGHLAASLAASCPVCPKRPVTTPTCTLAQAHGRCSVCSFLEVPFVDSSTLTHKCALTRKRTPPPCRGRHLEQPLRGPARQPGGPGGARGGAGGGAHGAAHPAGCGGAAAAGGTQAVATMVVPACGVPVGVR